MEPFRYHVFCCDQQKPEGAPCCSARGSARVIDTLRAEIGRQGLADDVQVTVCGSIGLCEHGPNMIVYPEGFWYAGVQAGDVAEIVRSHFANDQPVERLLKTDPAALRAEVVGNRDKYMAAMRAADAAGALPDDLHERIRGFQDSRVVLTALELDLFNAVGDGATAVEIASGLKTDLRGTEALLHALASLKLLEKREGVFRNTPVSTRYFTTGSKDDSRLALLHMANLWRTWSHLTESVTTGKPAPRGAPAGGVDGTESFIAAMHRNAAMRAAPVVRAVGAEGVRRMLDVGGGSGAYSIAFAKANPSMLVDVLDLAAVQPITERHISEEGLLDRIQFRAGDLRRDRLGSGYDLILISAICHMLGPVENRDLFGRAFEALSPGGRVVIQDFILEPDKTAPKWAALFALNMLVGTETGNTYNEAEYTEWLSGAGFRDVRRVRLPGPAGLMIAVR